MRQLLFILIILIGGLSPAFLSIQEAQATHNRAGEISYESKPLPNQPYRYEFTITTYTRSQGGGSEQADRDTLEINFGDGTRGQAPRVNGPFSGGSFKGEILPNTDIKKNLYQITHAYPGAFNFYVVSMEDPNRIAEIININFAASVDIKFYIEDTLFLLDPQFFGTNSSPILFQPPIDYANVGYTFIHNPNAFDPDGDSLYFELTVPRQCRMGALECTDAKVPLYQFPDEINRSANQGGIDTNCPEDPTLNVNDITLNSFTGEFEWKYPQQPGVYNIAFLIREFRNGVQIGTMIRDMQIFVEEVANCPPVIEELRDTCLLIGETLNVPIIANDPDVAPVQTVTLTAFGGPLEIENPAFFPSVSALGEATQDFLWETTCDHIYSEEYTIVIKAEDNFTRGNQPLPLTDLYTWQVTLVPQAPENLQATIIDREITLNWDVHPCASSEKFMGYTLWRKIGCEDTELERCAIDLESLGYEKIIEGISTTSFIDDTAIKGPEYSYRVTAHFADAFTLSNPPSPINVSSSMPSVNSCLMLPRDAPIITQVSVETTAINNGEILVSWVKPDGTRLDTLNVNQPPYTYILYRSEGLGTNNFAEIQRWTYDAFYLANDTSFIDLDIALNTEENAYTYKIGFLAGEEAEVVDETETASSVFLSIEPSDNQLFLSWEEQVPWSNVEYHIFKENNQGTFDSIGLSTNASFTDINLVNGVFYCYKIKAIGTYSANNLPDPLINYSQVACLAPIDTTASCPPTLSISNDCESDVIDSDGIYANNLEWTNPNTYCANDVVSYNVYYSSPLSNEFNVIETVEGATNIFYQHLLENTLAGCYAVTAVDSFQNESIFSNEICIENCLDFELPNVFTPNGDTQNEVFVPRKVRFVSSIDFKVYNRWGQIVYETNDPLINWDGIDIKTGEALPESVYYYACEVFEQTSDGVEILHQSLSGYIHLIRGE